MSWFARKSAHFHRWQPLSIQQGLITGTSTNGTAILFLCEACGEYRTQVIYGHWSLEDVQAKSREDELAELRKMAGLK